MRTWVLDEMKKNKSFENLQTKDQFRLVGLISKHLQELQENKGQEFFNAYQVVLGPILERVNWIYSKHPQFVWKRWNGIKREVLKTLQGRDQLVKVSPEVVRHQVNALQTMVGAFVNGHQLNVAKREKKWVKNPKGGWMRNPRASEV